MAKTHQHIATGHDSAKFGLSADAITHILSRPADFPCLRFEGIHVHIGSQLHDTKETVQAVQAVLNLIASYRSIRTINIGGGLPAVYDRNETLPAPNEFAEALLPLLRDYDVLLEPGRSIAADAGILVLRVLYRKDNGGTQFVIGDAGMTDLLRPMLYDAKHEIVRVTAGVGGESTPMQVVGPVCESTDVLGRAVPLATVEAGDLLAVLSAGAYGMVMANNYNARPRPPEVVVAADGRTWKIARRRETWDDLVRAELE
jgi:diaminopimelate decarboxylase